MFTQKHVCILWRDGANAERTGSSILPPTPPSSHELSLAHIVGTCLARNLGLLTAEGGRKIRSENMATVRLWLVIASVLTGEMKAGSYLWIFGYT